ncbi:hypothetical protein [Alkalispirochaeta sphaeroplastigenens]|uniref:hypothetical protein n=1 Tax=Alkalispirochaeta sphaeroplastigenens TaxID=1187066 RepID=UPI000CDB4284|nr:hypothetical protein [Alkalispirochaeta sphaeroplastigenens]
MLTWSVAFQSEINSETGKDGAIKETTKTELNRMLRELHKAHYAGFTRREKKISRQLVADLDRAKREEARA